MSELRLWLENTERLLNRRTAVIGGAIVLCGLVWRFYYASDFYLNPDEALHYLSAVHDWHGWIGFYRNATRVVHPPLFIAVLQGIVLFGHSERLLRSVPILAGALFPFFVMLWVRRLAGNAAGLCAQLLLTFSPTLIDLSTEVRAYSLAFLFLSVSLVLLEKALDDGSSREMVWFHVFLYLAILTEYSVAWFAFGLGVYALLRLWRNRPVGRTRTTWVLGQVGALGIYLFLYFTQIARFSHTGLVGMYHSSWLQGAFRQPQQSLFFFAVNGTFRQFKYLLQARWLAGIGLVIFLYGLHRIWRERSPLHTIPVILPFLVAFLAAVSYLYPYGATRHTAVLDIAIVAGMGIGVATLTRNRLLPILMAALPLIIIWHSLSNASYLDIAPERRHLGQMREATEFLRKGVPPGSVIVTDAGTSQMLGYYLGCPDYGYYDSDELYRMHQCGSVRFLVAPIYQFDGPADVRDACFEVRSKYLLDGPVWVAAGGFQVTVANSVSDSRPFGKAIAIFPTDSTKLLE
jgi:hypothetical protein